MNIELFVEYVMKTPCNSNVSIMRSLMSGVALNVQEKVITYVLTTPGNTNRAVLTSMLSTDVEPAATVGNAVVGYATVG